MPKTLLMLILFIHNLPGTSAGKNRDQKGQWIRVAPCLYRYRSSGVYDAFVLRSGKLIRRSIEKQTPSKSPNVSCGDFLGEQEHAAPDAHKTYRDVHMKEFLAERTGAPKTLKRYRQLTDHVCANWPGGAHQVLAKVDHSQCSKWLSQWNGKVAAYNHARQWLLAFLEFATANRKLQKSPMDKRLVKAMRRPQVIRNAPTPEKFDAILKEVRAQPFRTLRIIQRMPWGSWAGQAEASGLKWGHINFKDETIKLFRVKTQTSFKIPLFARLRELLDRLRAENPYASASDKVFKIGDPKKALATACRNLKLPAFSARSFRRMFIIEALKKGIAVKRISRWQGHKDGGLLILKTYSEVIEQEDDRAAANILA
jgi:integrase